MIFLNMWSIVIFLLIWDHANAMEWWNGWSLHNNNDRFQRDPLPVSPPTTKTEFKQLWYTKLSGPVEVTPTVYEQHVYVSTLAGIFYCIRADDGNILWQKNLSEPINNGRLYGSRTSSLIYKNMIILGLTDGNILQSAGGYGSYAIAFNRFTGILVWQQKVSSHPASMITATPQLANNRLFLGISSLEEVFALNPAYPCCTFQGSVVALNASTGAFLWERKMVPDNNQTTAGYSGK